MVSLAGNRTMILVGIPLLSLLLLFRTSKTVVDFQYWDWTAPLNYMQQLQTAAAAAPATSLQPMDQEREFPSIVASGYKKEEETKAHIAQSTADEKHPPTRRISLVVRMKGEMSNLISHLVFAKGIQWWTEQHYSSSFHNSNNNNDSQCPFMTLDMIGERQAGTKWKGAVKDLKTCFPNLRSIYFNGGRWDPDFRIRRQQQKAWVGEDNHRTKLVINRADSNCGASEWFCLHEQLAFLRKIIKQAQEVSDGSFPDYDSIAANLGLQTYSSESNNNYSLPFLSTEQQASFDVLVDQYFHRIKQWLKFDYEACCSPVRPDPDEVVFHFRNFRAEMGERNYFEKGYEELTPEQAATELLGHLPSGTKIAIASRGEAHVQSYIDAMQARGYHVRSTPSNHSGVQDFCFLLRAQRELVGTMRSTYTRWAALLGGAKRVQLYSMDSPWTRQAHGSPDSFPTSLHYQWRRRELKDKIQYRVFSSNATQ